MKHIWDPGQKTYTCLTDYIYCIYCTSVCSSSRLLITLLLYYRCAPKPKDGKRYFGQIKIILGFVQILAAMPGVLDSVPWPDKFLNFAIPLNFIYLDFLKVIDHCSLFAPFYDTFTLHMMAPGFLLIAVFTAHFVARKFKWQKNTRRVEILYQVLILGVLMVSISLILTRTCTQLKIISSIKVITLLSNLLTVFECLCFCCTLIK